MRGGKCGFIPATVGLFFIVWLAEKRLVHISMMGRSANGHERIRPARAPSRKVDIDGVRRPDTEHEKRLYAVCKLISKGHVSTYGALAKVLHSSAQAVGQVRVLRAAAHPQLQAEWTGM